ncbi:MAG TPA: hypothetical protein VGG27_14940 [Magnetospirillaceae bacterium]|jgi:hypothetical protein
MADSVSKVFDPDEPRDENGRWTVSASQSGPANRALRAKAVGRDVEIDYADGTTETRSGGTPAWRNNNPGNIECSTAAMSYGAIGCAGGFVVFPDEATGTQAMQSLLHSSKYAPLTLDAAIARWAPPKENNTARYQALVQQWTGLSGSSVIGTLSADQLTSVIGAIKRMEGWQVGTVRRTTSL